MAQFARPESDVAGGSWTAEGGPSTLWECLDESSPSDSDYIEDAGANSLCEVGLSAVTDPVSDIDHTLRVRIQGNGSGGPEKVNIRLLQGTTEIQAFNNQSSRGSWTTLNLAITAASSITDYTNLRAEMTANSLGGSETMWVSWVELEVPDAPAGGGAAVQMMHYRRMRQ